MTMDKIITTVAPIFSIITFFLGYYFNILIEKSKSDKELNKRYLNGLRLYLEETYNRLNEINKFLLENGNCTILTFIHDFSEIKKQDKHWFINEGCYLISSSYLVACLFGTIEKLREEYPYITIRKKDDTLILNKVFAINLAFLTDLSIFYVLQHNIGHLMYNKSEERLLNYAEFVELIVNDNSSIWFERLINFMIAVGEGKKNTNLKLALDAIDSLSNYLENKYKLGPSIKNRLEMERNK
jgi:hypothetical protein